MNRAITAGDDFDNIPAIDLEVARLALLVAYTFPSENAWLATPFWVLIGRFRSVARLGIDPRVESKAMERDQVSGVSLLNLVLK